MELKPEIVERLNKLDQKYQAMGQDLVSYLDGLLYADYLTYWDYIHLDTLLTLQTPKTQFPDEHIFIMYHQVTELFFKLSIHEFEQIGNTENITADFLMARLKRIINYFRTLISSFDIMVEGMEPQQFLKFRMSLLPASGFQSAQYRMIEIYSTDFNQLMAKEFKKAYPVPVRADLIPEMFENIYWKQGATELSSGKKTLTLRQFEDKYSEKLIRLATDNVNKNLYYKYKQLPDEDQKNPELRELMRKLDVYVNINWPLSHYKSAVRYLHKNPEDIAATGGTNWQKYLPPRFQKRIFYPELWSSEEHEEWGKTWVKEEIFNLKS